MAERPRSGAFALLPGGLVVYLAFNAGGYFPNTQGLVAAALLLGLAAWIVLAEEPFAGFSWPLAMAAGALAAYALWALASASWSDSTSRALIEFDRVLLYLAALLFFGLTVRGARALQWLVWGMVGGIVVVCAVGLTTRLLPNVWPISANLAYDRLSFPITYWNTLGLLAALGTIFSLSMATRARGPRVTRVLGAAAIPLLATTLYFTFSRGAILAGAIGTAAYLLVARPRGTVSGLVAALPAAAIVLIVAYHADLLATQHPTSPAAVSQGHRVAWVLAGCTVGAALIRVAFLSLDARVRRMRHVLDQRTARVAAAGALAVTVAVALAVGAPGWAGRQYDAFVHGAPVSEGSTENTGTDFRQRLTSASSNGRLDYWGTALDQFEAGKLEGGGAGTFQLAWERQRNYPGTVVDAHGLYAETLGELGLVGVVLLVTALAAILAGLAVQIWGRDRSVHAVLLAAALAWAAAAAVDWHWEMPVVTLWLFAAGGAALASVENPPWLPAPAVWVRLIMAIALVFIAVLPFRLFSSQASLNRADEAFARGNCAAASDDARSSISALSARPEPYELLGYCAIRRGNPRQAIDEMRKAVDRDPNSWNFHFGLALALGSAGLDPRAELRRAHDLNPLDVLTEGAEARFKADRPGLWKRRAEELASRLTSL